MIQLQKFVVFISFLDHELKDDNFIPALADTYRGEPRG